MPATPHIFRPLKIALFVLTICTALLLSGRAVHAQTKLGPKMLEAYKQNCMAQQDERLSRQTQQIFCQCTAMFAKRNFSVEDMQTLARKDGAARQAMNKMMVNVYAPCMEFPVRDLIYNRCMQRLSGGDKVCKCLSDRMAKFTAQNAQQQLAGILKQNPEIQDPMSAIVNSQSFAQKEQEVALQCAKKGM